MNVTAEEGPVCCECGGPEIGVYLKKEMDFFTLSSGKSYKSDDDILWHVHKSPGIFNQSIWEKHSKHSRYAICVEVEKIAFVHIFASTHFVLARHI